MVSFREGGTVLYPMNLSSSAKRHFKAGETLNADTNPDRQCRSVAGYLYGIAGECALKYLMWNRGWREIGDKMHDPFYAHFPELKTMLMQTLKSRHDSALYRVINIPGLMQNWDTSMRYSAAKEISDFDINKWKNHTKTILDSMEGL
jgi:hypothetical protein